MQNIEALHMVISSDSVQLSILNYPKIKLKSEHACVIDKAKLRIYPAGTDMCKLQYELHKLKSMLPKVIVKGIPTVERAVITKTGDRYNLLVDGSATEFRCPFCPGKKKQDYRYNELLQHAVGVGASNHAAKVKANHQALANLLKIDYADDAAGSLPSRQVVAPSNPPRPMQDQELFVWPWMGILANVPAEQTKGDGAILMRQLAEFNPLQFNVVYCFKGYTGFAVVCFTKDWIGFKNYWKNALLESYEPDEAIKLIEKALSKHEIISEVVQLFSADQKHLVQEATCSSVQLCLGEMSVSCHCKLLYRQALGQLHVPWFCMLHQKRLALAVSVMLGGDDQKLVWGMPIPARQLLEIILDRSNLLLEFVVRLEDSIFQWHFTASAWGQADFSGGGSVTYALKEEVGMRKEQKLTSGAGKRVCRVCSWTMGPLAVSGERVLIPRSCNRKDIEKMKEI